MEMLKKLFFIGLLLVGCYSDVGYPTLDGESIDVASPGKLLVINYWAVWCAPCRKEIPELNELAAHLVDRLTVLGVNFDGSQNDTLRSEISKLGIQFPSFTSDPRVTWGLEPVSVLPETLIISPEGKLLHRLIGPQTLASLEALL
jgi:thiol-disulfide isomerase/thioredoxin